MAFFDELTGGLVGGGMKMLSNMFAQDYAQDAANRQQVDTQANMFTQAAMNSVAARQAEAFTRERQQEAMEYNARQADIARQFSAEQLTRAQDFSSAQAEQARSFQERMSSSAYQRATADMRAAGINPMVAFSQGGASTPSGASASSSAPGTTSASIGGASGTSSAVGLGAAPHRSFVAPLEGAITSALEGARLKPQIDQIKQQTAVMEKDEGLRLSQRDVTREQAIKTARETKEVDARIDNIRADTQNKLDEAGKVRLLGSEFQPEKTQRVLSKFLSQVGEPGASGISSAVAWLRGMMGDGTGGK